MTADRFAPIDQNHSQELANPLIVRDFSRCILCGRCVQACNEDSYAMQKLFRSVFKTNNIDHCART